MKAKKTNKKQKRKWIHRFIFNHSWAFIVVLPVTGRVNLYVSWISSFSQTFSITDPLRSLFKHFACVKGSGWSNNVIYAKYLKYICCILKKVWLIYAKLQETRFPFVQSKNHVLCKNFKSYKKVTELAFWNKVWFIVTSLLWHVWTDRGGVDAAARPHGLIWATAANTMNI